MNSQHINKISYKLYLKSHAHYSSYARTLSLSSHTQVCLSRTLLLLRMHTIAIFAHAQRSASHAHYSSHARTLQLSLHMHRGQPLTHTTPLTHAHYSYLCTCTEVCLSCALLLLRMHTIAIFTHAQRSASHAHYSSHKRTLQLSLHMHRGLPLTHTTPPTHAHYIQLSLHMHRGLPPTHITPSTHTIAIFAHAQRSASHAHYSSHARTLYIAIFANAQRSASHAHYSFHAHYSYLCTCTEVCLPRTLLLARTHTSYLCTQRSASHTRLLPAMCFRFTIRLKMEKGTF